MALPVLLYVLVVYYDTTTPLVLLHPTHYYGTLTSNGSVERPDWHSRYRDLSDAMTLTMAIAPYIRSALSVGWLLL